MSKTQKIQKLANAIKAFRGRFDEKSKKWITPPNPGKEVAVLVWAQRLNLPPKETLQRALGFASFQDFNNWIASL